MAISSELAVCNLALNAVGARNNISSLVEQSREAEVCNLWYSAVRDQVMASAPWPSSIETKYLALIAEADEDGDGEWAYDDPRPGYQYVYGYPADSLRPLYMSDYSRFLVTGLSDNRRAIHSNTANAILVYIKRSEIVSIWDPQLQMAIVYAIAAYICMPLSGKPTRARTLIAQANELILEARTTAANASNEAHDWVPDWIQARGYNFGLGTRYYYPYGSMLSLTNVS